MPPLNFSRIVSFSSEEPTHPATSLLSKGKWACKDEGEPEAWVILQLEEMSIISDLDLGNNGAAFIEVQVGRLGMEVKDYQTLLVASSFMSPGEARLGDKATRVRMFSSDQFSATSAKEKWDMVKVVATQPFTKHSRYGLAFITVSGKTASGAPPSVPGSLAVKLGAFKLKEEKKDEIAVGSLFRRQKEQGASESSSVAASLRADKTLADMALVRSEKEETKRKRSEEEGGGEMKPKKIRPVNGDLPRRDCVPGESRADMFKNFEPKKEATKERVKNVKQSDLRKERKAIEEDLNERVKKYKKQEDVDEDKGKNPNGRVSGEGSSRSTHSDQEAPKISKAAGKESQKEPNSKNVESDTTKKTAPFRDLLRGVVFALSGFQNPLRGEIRGKAMEMGAKYEPDWSSRCTHLICAFANTPKFQQVKTSGGKIVKREWVEECHSRRRRLPWRRFCLDRADRGEESEEEVWEEAAVQRNNANGASRHPVHPYEQDTDEEVEQLKQRDAKEAEDEKKKLDAEKRAEELKWKEKEETEEKKRVRKEREEKMEETARKKEEAEKVINEKNSAKTEARCYDMETDEEDVVEDVESKLKLADDHDSAYDADTDVDDDIAEKLRQKTDHLDYPQMPSFFSSLQFYMHGNYDKGEKELITRYIIAFGGKILPVMKKTVSRVITASNWWSDDFKEMLILNPDVIFLRPSWIFACSDQQKLVAEGTHRVIQ